MKHDAKSNVQSEGTNKQKGQKPPIQYQESATHNLENLTQADLQRLSPADVVRLSGIIGNRAVARLMAKRPGEEEDIPGPRNQYRSPVSPITMSGLVGSQAAARPMTKRPGEEEEIPGPRLKPQREYTGQQRGDSDLSSSPAGGSRVAGQPGNIGDASNLDGEGLYGWDRPMSASDVAAVVNGLVPNMSSEDIYEPDRIVIFSGTHGTATGNLVNTGAGAFVGEDQATAAAAMAASPGAQIEVIDVNSYTSKDQLTSSVFGATNYIRIAAWCYSKRSYNNRATLTANWWPAAEAD